MSNKMPKYKTIVIDPPWRITTTGPNSKPCHGTLKRRLDYKTMSDREIFEFPIDDFAHKNCNLFLWTTHKKLPFALEIIKNWGFKHYCMFTWIKNSGMTMQGVFRNSELAIFAYRGEFNIPFTGKAIPTAFSAKTGVHSEKPAEFYDIVRSKTQTPRIDIFARRQHYGFTAWGDEVEPLQAEPQQILTK